MHVTFALFADAANLSQEGKLNIMGVFDALQVGTLPALHPRATLVVHLKGSAADAGTHRVSLQWLSPSGTEGLVGVTAMDTSFADVTVSFVASDDKGPGVKSISYSTSGSQTTADTTVQGASAQVVISTDGVTTVSFAHRGLWDEEAVRSHEGGWGRVLDNLGRTLQETNPR